MNIGVLIVDIHIPLNNSLKGKRMVLQSLKRRIRTKFNVSVSETGSQDLWQRAHLSIAIVGSDKRVIDSTLLAVKKFILKESRIEILDYQLEMI